MLLVIGSAFDDRPRRLVERWTRDNRDAILVTPADVSRPGWRLRCGQPAECCAAIAERTIAGDEIDGVVTSLAWIAPHELPHIDEDDREYVAQEIGAFLLAWLSELRCPVVDRPSPLSLAGCGRSSHEWAAIAARLGVPARPIWDGPTTTVTVVGGRAVGDSDLAPAAEMVAAAVARSLVTLRFSDVVEPPALVGADASPDVGNCEVADTLLAWMDHA
jgi:hypothetical protein